jgi:SAM-dependent methyltransferase
MTGAVQLCHHFLRQQLHLGDRVVDATCGNGHDTLFLAELVGESGRVYAFDIQEAALARTAERLTAAGVAERVTLLHAGHEELSRRVSELVRGVVFNLGYLPGGDKGVITRPETTLASLEQAISLVEVGGFIAIVLYPGHGGGDEESALVEEWGRALDRRQWVAWSMRRTNLAPTAPWLLLLEKQSPAGP